MKKGDIILLRCPNKKITPVLIIGKKAENIIGLQVQGYSEMSDIKNNPSKKIKKHRNFTKEKLEEKKIQLEKMAVIIGKPDGLRYNSIVKINREFVIDVKNVIATISEIDDKLFYEVLNIYKSYRKKQALHRELHTLKQKIFLCQMNNEKYNDYEDRLIEVLKELDYPEIKRMNNERAYLGYREVPTSGYIKVYRGGR